MNVWNVGQSELEGLSLEDLKDFRNQAYSASVVAEPFAKEQAIDHKVALADKEIAKRQKK